MSSQRGRDLLLKIGNGGGPETFTTIGAARTVAALISNQPVDATAMEDLGIQTFKGDAGTQSLKITLDGIFRDAAAEEMLRAAAFGRTEKNFKLCFPNGDTYAAAFVITEYGRGGAHDGLETFTVTLLRSGTGTYTAA